MCYQWLVSFSLQKWPNSTSRIFFYEILVFDQSEDILKVSGSLIAITRCLALEKEIWQDSI